MNLSRSLLFVASLSVLAPSFAFAQDGGKPPAPPAGQEQGEKKKETYAVIETEHHLQVVAESKLDTMRKEKRQAYEAALKDFEKAKADAEAKKEKFERKAPVEATIQIKKGGLASMADAEKVAQEMRKEMEKGKSGEKPHEKTGDKPNDKGKEGGHGEKPKHNG